MPWDGVTVEPLDPLGFRLSGLMGDFCRGNESFTSVGHPLDRLRPKNKESTCAAHLARYIAPSRSRFFEPLHLDSLRFGVHFPKCLDGVQGFADSVHCID